MKDDDFRRSNLEDVRCFSLDSSVFEQHGCCFFLVFADDAVSSVFFLCFSLYPKGKRLLASVTIAP